MGKALSLSGEDYIKIFDKCQIPILLMDIDAPSYTIIGVNAGYLEVTNSTHETLVGNSVFGAFPANPTDEESKNIERTIFSFEEAIRTKSTHTMSNYRYDIPIRGTNQFEERYWTTSNTPVLDESGNVKFLVHSPLNVTALNKLAEKEKTGREALAHQRQQLHATFMQAPVGIGIFKGPDYIVELLNPSLAKICGKSFEEMRGKGVFESLTTVKDLGFEELLTKVRLTGTPYHGIATPVPLIRNGKDETVYIDFVFEPFREDNGSISGVIVVAIEITDQVESKQKLEESEAQFRFMAEAMPQQVWTADVEGKVDYINERSLEYFGQTLEEVIRAGWSDYIYPADLQKCADNWRESLQTQTLYQVESRLRRADGKYRWHLTRALPLKLNETVVKWIGTNTDIEEHKHLEQQKDEFIGIASHELKTPVTSIKAYTQILEKILTKKGETKEADMVSRMDGQVNRLSRLIGDLLDVTKISSGKLQFNDHEFDFNSYVAELIEDLQRTSENHTLVKALADTGMVYADKERIDQVITNFITNATKYSPNADQVIISSKTENNEITLSVQDFGIGIAKEDLGKVFQQFYRANSNVHYTFSGLGLGLFISDEIIKREGGRIWVESTEGKGSTFSFTLPLREL